VAPPAGSTTSLWGPFDPVGAVDVPEWWDGKIEKPSDSDDGRCLASLVYVLILLALVAVIL
jgi:hypothetical protein